MLGPLTLLYIGPRSRDELRGFEREIQNVFESPALALDIQPLRSCAELETLKLPTIPALVFIDGDVEGFASAPQLKGFLKEMRERDAEIPILVVSESISSGAGVLDWIDKGVTGFLNPRFRAAQLSDSLRELLLRRLEQKGALAR